MADSQLFHHAVISDQFADHLRSNDHKEIHGHAIIPVTQSSPVCSNGQGQEYARAVVHIPLSHRLRAHDYEEIYDYAVIPEPISRDLYAHHRQGRCQ
jgi:hypothetical protein